MKGEIKRAVVALIILGAVFLLSGPIIGGTGSYNIYVEAIKFLAAVIAAGCYWIGSRPADGK